jgi:hypothetical protein
VVRDGPVQSSTIGLAGSGGGFLLSKAVAGGTGTTKPREDWADKIKKLTATIRSQPLASNTVAMIFRRAKRRMARQYATFVPSRVIYTQTLEIAAMSFIGWSGV